MRKRVFSATVAVLVVVLAGLWFSDTLRIPTNGPTLAGGAESNQPLAAAKRGPGGASQEPAHRAINPLQPLKLWIGGDSLAGALGPSLGTLTANTGVVQPQYDSRVGSGLMSGNIDWMKHAQEQMDLLKPEAVVFIIGTNDANVYDDSQAVQYAELTDKMMRILVGDGREVYWVNAPVMRDSRLEKNILKVDAIQRAVASKIPEVTFVDAHTLFADDAGHYQSSLPDATGETVLMRAGDGIHLTGAGGDHLARAIFTVLERRWKILEQAVVGQPKKVLVTKGSTQIGGNSSGNSSSGSSSGSSSQSYHSSGSSNHNSTSGTTATTRTTLAQPPPPPPSTTATTTATTATTTTAAPGP